MPQLRRISTVPAPLDQVFSFFSDPANLARITPPELGFRIVEVPAGGLKAGSLIRYTIRLAGLRLGWTTRIDEWNDGSFFVDSQLRGPYRKWVHRHQFRSIPGGVEMTDTVDYELPLGWLGGVVAGWMVRRQLRRIFDYRESVISDLFGQPAAKA